MDNVLLTKTCVVNKNSEERNLVSTTVEELGDTAMGKMGNLKEPLKIIM